MNDTPHKDTKNEKYGCAMHAAGDGLELYEDGGDDRVTTNQWMYLLNAVEGDPELRGTFSAANGRSRVSRKWADLAKELNALPGGTSKDGRHWHLAYINLKSRAKGALASKVHRMFGTGGGPPMDTVKDLQDLGLSDVYSKCCIAAKLKVSAIGNRSVPNPLQVQHDRRDGVSESAAGNRGFSGRGGSGQALGGNRFHTWQGASPSGYTRESAHRNSPRRPKPNIGYRNSPQLFLGCASQARSPGGATNHRNQYDSPSRRHHSNLNPTADECMALSPGGMDDDTNTPWDAHTVNRNSGHKRGSASPAQLGGKSPARKRLSFDNHGPDPSLPSNDKGVMLSLIACMKDLQVALTENTVAVKALSGEIQGQSA